MSLIVICCYFVSFIVKPCRFFFTWRHLLSFGAICCQFLPIGVNLIILCRFLFFLSIFCVVYFYLFLFLVNSRHFFYYYLLSFIVSCFHFLLFKLPFLWIRVISQIRVICCHCLRRSFPISSRFAALLVFWVRLRSRLVVLCHFWSFCVNSC